MEDKATQSTIPSLRIFTSFLDEQKWSALLIHLIFSKWYVDMWVAQCSSIVLIILQDKRSKWKPIGMVPWWDLDAKGWEPLDIESWRGKKKRLRMIDCVWLRLN